MKYKVTFTSKLKKEVVKIVIVESEDNVGIVLKAKMSALSDGFKFDGRKHSVSWCESDAPNEPKKVTIYDFKSYIEKKEPGWTSQSYEDDYLAIVRNGNKFFVFCNEGLGWFYKMDELLKLGVVKDDGSIKLSPEGIVKMTMREVIESNDIPKRQSFIHDFIRDIKFKDRLKANYYEMIKAITELGLNGDDYKMDLNCI